MAVQSATSSIERVFYKVDGASDKMGDLRAIFERVLTPLYGPQEKALHQIAEATDRHCYLLYEREEPVGVIVFKTTPSNEFAAYDVRESIEIKSLFVVNSDNNSGRGLGSTLLNKIVEEVNRLALGHLSLHVTVSQEKPESLAFFQRKGFRVVHQWNGKYQPNTIEYLLARVAAALDAVISREMPPLPKVFAAIKNAHFGDVHTLTLLSDGTFTSGSKDNTLCKWDLHGKLLRVVHEVEPTAASPQKWVTAASIVNERYWVSGKRDGHVDLWTTEGEFVRQLYPKLPKQGHISLPENARRVTCLAAGLDMQKPSVFVGYPTLFGEYNLVEGKTVSLTHVHNNDWVYCIHPLTTDRLLTATAGSLDSWEKREGHWQKTASLIKEEQKKRGEQRAFISSLAPLPKTNQVALGVFGGYVRIVDVETGKVMQQWSEHRQRIWDVKNLGNLLISSAEDQTIKVWDPRVATSICSLDAQACALLALSDKTFVAGGAQPALAENRGADLTFYDLRLSS